MEYALALLLLLVAIAFVVARPLFASASSEEPDEPLVQELEAAKEAKYREIRDAELDYRMGKLSEEDWRRVDRELRAEALEILRKLERLH